MDLQVFQRRHNDGLVGQFDAATPDLAVLADTLHEHVLAQLELELADLSDPDILKWLSEWLSDTASLFRLFKRHNFIRPFTLQEIRSIAIWRIRVLRPLLALHIPPLFHCLPPPITDPIGRPIIFLKLATLSSLPCSAKDALLQEVERLRLHLRYIRDQCDTHTGSFPLQYLVLVDLDGVSIQNCNLDLCSWILTDIIPRYPGMLAAVFLLNYSWIHAGAWSLARRVLPSSIIGRVFFPSRAQLVGYCSAANLPADYGGSLPTLDRIDNALRSSWQTHHLPPPPFPNASHPLVENPPLTTPSPHSPNATLQRTPSTIALHPLSSQNPFFGYPTVASASSPHTIRPVQRGVRELVRTLAVLWWRRWGRWVWRCAGTAVIAVIVWALRVRMRRTRLVPGMTAETTLRVFFRAMSSSTRARRVSS